MQENMNTKGGIGRLEVAAAELYKALQASRDRGQIGFKIDVCRSTHILRRYGSIDGTIAGIPAAEQSILQTDIRFPATDYDRTSEL